MDYGEERVEISVSVLKEFRGRHLASAALAESLEILKKEKKVKTVIAEIHRENVSSEKLFERFNFKYRSAEGEFKKYALDIGG